MEPLRWIPRSTRKLLDIGCNEGALLETAAREIPEIELAGCDVNRRAIEDLKSRRPEFELHCVGADRLPFENNFFDCLTCIEVLEHIPPALWKASLAEMNRVLKPNGLAILRTPHAGAFSFLDSNNLRFRFPAVYRRLVGSGRRDSGFDGGSEEVMWHYHFHTDEFRNLLGQEWTIKQICYGGLILFPLCDIVCWPFYRFHRHDHWIPRLMHRVMNFEYSFNFGSASYGVLVVAEKR
jgi:SAM-dependent methyltransferase